MRTALVKKSETAKYRVRSSPSVGLTRMGGGGGGGGSSNMSSMLRMLLRTSYPIEKLSLKLGRKADIYR